MGAGRFAGRTAVGATRMAARGAVGAVGLTTTAFMGDPDAVVKAAALGLGAAAVGRVKSGITSGVRKGIGALTDSGSDSGGTAGSPARVQAEQPLTEKTFNEFATKFLGYMETLVGLSQDELRAAQNQELRTREMLAEATGQGSVPTSLRKKKKSATDLLKLLGLGALLMALGKAAKGGTIPDLKPVIRAPVKTQPKTTRQTRTRTTQRTQPRTTTRQNRRTNRASRQAQTRAGQPRPGTLRPSRATRQAEIRAGRAERPGAPAKVESEIKKPGSAEKVEPEQRRGIISGIAQRVIGRAVPVAGTALAVVDAIKDASEGDIVGVLTNAGIIAGTIATLFPPTAIAGVNIIGTAVVADFLNELDKGGVTIGEGEAMKILKEEFEIFKKNFNKIADDPQKYEEQLKDVKVASMEQYRRMNPGAFEQLEGTTREEQKRIRDIDKQRFDELGGTKGTGVRFSRFREGQQALRAQELERRAFEEAEGDTTAQELRTDIGTPIRIDEPDEAYMGPPPTPSADASGATLQRSSASMAAASDDLSAIAAADDGGSAEVAGSTVVNATGQEIDIAGNDNARADSLADGRNTETMRLKSLVARTMNPDPTFGKAMAKSLVTTA